MLTQKLEPKRSAQLLYGERSKYQRTTPNNAFLPFRFSHVKPGISYPNCPLSSELKTLRWSEPGEKPLPQLELEFEINFLEDKDTYWLSIFDAGSVGSPVQITVNFGVFITNQSEEGTIDSPVPFGDGAHLTLSEIAWEFGQCLTDTYVTKTLSTTERRSCSAEAFFSGYSAAIRALPAKFVKLRLVLDVSTQNLLPQYFPDLLRFDYHLDITLGAFNVALEDVRLRRQPIHLSESEPDSDSEYSVLSDNSENH